MKKYSIEKEVRKNKKEKKEYIKQEIWEYSHKEDMSEYDKIRLDLLKVI